MSSSLAFEEVRLGYVPAAQAWELLTPVIGTTDHVVAKKIYSVLRSWTWKALDRRRRDDGLREWIDVLNRAEGFLVENFTILAAKVEVLAELLHESIAVGQLIRPEDLLKRRHVPDILATLGDEGAEWLPRSVLMNKLQLRPANTTRLMTQLVDAGWVEQVEDGREAAYRLSAEGSLNAPIVRNDLVEETVDLTVPDFVDFDQVPLTGSTITFNANSTFDTNLLGTGKIDPSVNNALEDYQVYFMYTTRSNILEVFEAEFADKEEEVEATSVLTRSLFNVEVGVSVHGGG